MFKNITYTKPSMPPMEEYVKEIQELWDTRWITNVGKKHIIFQRNQKNRSAI